MHFNPNTLIVITNLKQKLDDLKFKKDIALRMLPGEAYLICGHV